MREIKFRVWDKKNKRMVVLDNLMQIVGFCKACVETGGSPTGDFEWMQYIGLKDKNGKEIHEGDIGKEEFTSGGIGVQRVGEIIRKKGCYFFQGKYPFCIVEPEEHLEIIGNIYENKELLK